MKRYLILYFTTALVLLPLDFLFLGVLARNFFAGEVGSMLGEVKPLPAALFYLLYILGILIFVSGAASASLGSALASGALFGLFCYATFELTSLSLLRHWSWRVALLDISWGMIVTAVSATIGLFVTDWITPRA